MTGDDDTIGVVVDAGSHMTKAGFSGEPGPRAVFPTAVGRFRHDGLVAGLPGFYFGDDAVRNRGVSNVTWPIKNGLIDNWDEMEKLWHYVFYSGLHAPPEQCRILHAVSPLVSGKDREKMVEILFESFSCRSINLVKEPVLVLHASGRTTGVVYENGFSSSYVAPIFEGFPLHHSIMTSPLTGQALTKRFVNLLKEIGYSFTTNIELDLVNKMKAELCYVAVNYEDELFRTVHSENAKVNYALPDGQHVEVQKERFLCPEALFQPSLEGLNCPSIIDLICSSIDTCDIDYKVPFYGSIVVSGGSNKFPGLVPRILSELSKRPKDISRIQVKIDDLPSKQMSVWVGGSIVSSLDCLNGFWLTKQEYDDNGSDSANYKFF